MCKLNYLTLSLGSPVELLVWSTKCYGVNFIPGNGWTGVCLVLCRLLIKITSVKKLVVLKIATISIKEGMHLASDQSVENSNILHLEPVCEYATHGYKVLVISIISRLLQY